MTKALISKEKPDASEFRRPDPNIGQWNNKTEESYEANGFSTESFKSSQEKVFLSHVDIRKAPIERTVTKIVRLKAIDWSSEKHERKEYLYYYEDWEGQNWLGIRIPPVTEHVEGYYFEQLREAEYDPKTGEPLRYKRKGQREAYYIPFNKTTVDKIIKGSSTTNQETIKYVVKFGAEDSDGHHSRQPTRQEFTYDQFVNWTFKELYDLNKSPIWNNSENKNIGPIEKTLYK